MTDTERRRRQEGRGCWEGTPGIVIASPRERTPASRAPRIAAFIWGGKTRPVPTLPFGRWKGAA